MLLLGNPAALGSSSGGLVVNGGVVDLGGFSPTAGAVVASGSIINSGAAASLQAPSYLLQAGRPAPVLGGGGEAIKDYFRGWPF